MARIKIEDIIFWTAIIIVIAIIIWKLFGSPSVQDILISTVSFLIIAGLALWRSQHSLEKEIIKIDNKTSIGFMRVKHDIDNFRKEINHRLDNIEELIKRKR